MNSSRGTGKSMLFLCFSALTAYTMSGSAFAPILDLIRRDLHLSYTGAGMVASTYFLGYAIGQVPWGLLVDRCGGRKVLAASVFGAGLSTSLFAASTSEGVAFLTRFICGLSAAGVFVTSIRVVSGWFPERSRGVALGTLGVGSSLPILVLGFASPFAAHQLGWRGAIQVFAGVSIVDSLALWFFLRDPPQAISENRGSDVDPSVKEILVDPGFWALGYVQFTRYGVHNLVIAWIAVFLMETYGLPLWLAGGALSLMFVITIVSDPVGGFTSDRIGRIPVLLASLISLSAMLTVLALNRNELILWPLLAGVGWVLVFYRGSLFALVPVKIRNFENWDGFCRSQYVCRGRQFHSSLAVWLST